jgi:hypothetical protein
MKYLLSKEAAMNPSRRNVPVYRVPHPAIYGLMAGSAALTVLALWLLFGDGGGATLSLLVVTGFSAAFMVTPWLLWRAAPRKEEDDAPQAGSLRAWLEGEFEADRGTIGAKHAMAMILLLPAAFAIGLVAISFIAHLAAIGAL